MGIKENKQRNDLNVFRLLRIARDKKVKELAEELEVTPAYINAIENGERTPSNRLLRDYAHALGVKEETILYFQQNEKKDQKFEHLMLSLLKMICQQEDCKT